jgi:hypothetical protein
VKKPSFEFLLSLLRPSGLQSRTVVAVAEEREDVVEVNDLSSANFSVNPAVIHFVTPVLTILFYHSLPYLNSSTL